MRSLYGYMLSFFLGKYLFAECLNHTVGACLTFLKVANLRIDKLFSIMVIPTYTLTSRVGEYESYSSLTSSPALDMISLLNLILVLICTSLMTNDSEHFFMGLFAIHISCLVNYLLKSFALLLLGFFYLFQLLSYKYSLHTLNANSLSDI